MLFAGLRPIRDLTPIGHGGSRRTLIGRDLGLRFLRAEQDARSRDGRRVWFVGGLLWLQEAEESGPWMDR